MSRRHGLSAGNSGHPATAGPPAGGGAEGAVLGGADGTGVMATRGVVEVVLEADVVLGVTARVVVARSATVEPGTETPPAWRPPRPAQPAASPASTVTARSTRPVVITQYYGTKRIRVDAITAWCPLPTAR